MGSGPGAQRDDLVAVLAGKDAEIAAPASRIAEFGGLVAVLRAQMGRNSSNSSKPPSSDSPFVKKPAVKRSSRQRSGKKPGKQPGSPGTTLRLVDDPDDTIVHTPSACGGCGNSLHGAVVFATARHQVFDAPATPPKPFVTEHRAVALTCGGCGTTTDPPVPGIAAAGSTTAPGSRPGRPG